MADGRVKRFFRGAWRVLDGVRRAVHLLLMLVVLALLLALLASQPLQVPMSTVLVVKPEGVLVEELAGHPFDLALAEARGDARAQTLLRDVVDAIDQAAADERVKALYLDLDSLQGGSLDKLYSVTEAVERFRAAGKPVVAAGGGFDQSQYFLAAHADEVYLHPLGGVFLDGFGYYRPYFKTALDKLSVDWFVFRTGEHKTYGDSYTRSEMSAAEKEDVRPVLEGLWSTWREQVSAARKIEARELDRYLNRFPERLAAAEGDLAKVALESGLVDELWTFDQVENRLAELGMRDPETGSYVGLDHRQYLAALDATVSAVSGPSVGLIVASGDILPGQRPPGTIGDETLASMIREARQDGDIKALVLRVDSGGGSQFASEVIQREVELVRAAGKPVIVSMGGTAASGGYVIALPADEIWAHATTVTGSIGVIASVPNFHRALGRLGVNVDGLGTHRLSGDFRLDRPLGKEAQQVIQLAVDGAYDRFVSQVARARGLDEASVRRIGGGRIWLGDAARRLGLVDRIGTLQDAIDSAVSRAGLGEDARVRVLEQPLSLGESLMLRFFAGLVRAGFDPARWGRLAGLPAGLAGVAEELTRLATFDDPRGLFYHCLCGAAQ